MAVHRAAGPAQGHVGTCDCRIRRSCVSDAWHGMWVVGMSYEVCAVMRMQCLIAVVGNAGLYIGFRDCTAMCEAVTVSFAGLMWGLKCVHVWCTHEFWVVGMLHVVCATMGMQCIGGCGRACMAVHRAAGPAQGHVGGGWLCVAHGCGVRVQMCVGDPAWQWYVSCGAVVGFGAAMCMRCIGGCGGAQRAVHRAAGHGRCMRGSVCINR